MVYVFVFTYISCWKRKYEYSSKLMWTIIGFTKHFRFIRLFLSFCSCWQFTRRKVRYTDSCWTWRKCYHDLYVQFGRRWIVQCKMVQREARILSILAQRAPTHQSVSSTSNRRRCEYKLSRTTACTNRLQIPLTKYVRESEFYIGITFFQDAASLHTD